MPTSLAPAAARLKPATSVDFSPIEPDGHSFVDTVYTRAFLHHLFKTDEILGLQIASIHNLAFYRWLMNEARMHIINGDFTGWKKGIIQQLSQRV